MFEVNPIFFYWDGGISPNRMKILTDSIYSTRVFNPTKQIVLVSNSIEQNQLEAKFNIKVQKWDKSFFDGLPISDDKIQQYMNAHPRDFSDLFRLVLLWKFGGSYVDTDDLCIKPLSDTPNLICRSYDPHTSFYNNITDEMCVPGRIREIEGYSHINTFPRNDCWQNWNPKSKFITDLLWNDKFLNNPGVVWIGGEFSWQSLTNETCIKLINEYGVSWNYGLTLLYLFEDFVSVSSAWDRCIKGGEMCDIWKDMEGINDYQWGFYKSKKEDVVEFYKIVCDKYPNLSHLWLHSKDEKEEWFIDIEEDGKYSVSTWIYELIKRKINEWQ